MRNRLKKHEHETFYFEVTLGKNGEKGQKLWQNCHGFHK